MDTTAESTLGGGTKQPFGTFEIILGSPYNFAAR